MAMLTTLIGRSHRMHEPLQGTQSGPSQHISMAQLQAERQPCRDLLLQVIVYPILHGWLPCQWQMLYLQLEQKRVKFTHLGTSQHMSCACAWLSRNQSNE